MSHLPRIFSLALTFASSAVAGLVGLNAAFQISCEKQRLKQLAPGSINFDINASEIEQSGKSVTAACYLVSFLAIFFFFKSLFPNRGETGTISSPRTFRSQAAALGVSALWLIGSASAYTWIFAERSFKILATTQDGSLISAEAMRHLIEDVGAETTYSNFGYLKLLAVFPWIAMFFTLFSTAILFNDSFERFKPIALSSTSTLVSYMGEKAAMEIHEREDA